MSNEENDKANDQEDTSLDVYYEKGQSYLNFHCDGSIATPSGGNQIVVSIFNERFTIPKHVKMKPSPKNDGEVREQVVEGKSGIFRQVECSIFLSPDAARDLINGIQEVLTFLEDQTDKDGES